MQFIKITFIALWALSTAVASAQTRVKAGEKPKLAVMPTDAVKLRQTAGSKESVSWNKNRVEHETNAAPLFADESQITAFAEAATQKIVGSFQRLNRLTVLDRTAMEKILQEQNFQMSDNADQKSQVQMGQLLGAQFIVTSQIQGVSTSEKQKGVGKAIGFLSGITGGGGLTYEGSVDMHVSIIDITTGEVVDQSPIKGSTDFISGESTPNKAMMKALDKCGDAIYDWLKKVYPVEGIIFSVDKEKKGEAIQVTISCGRNMGVKKKDEFKVILEESVDVDGRTVTKSKNIGNLKVNGLEEDGEFARCNVDEGGKDILEKFKNKSKLKVVSRH